MSAALSNGSKTTRVVDASRGNTPTAPVEQAVITPASIRTETEPPPVSPDNIPTSRVTENLYNYIGAMPPNVDINLMLRTLQNASTASIDHQRLATETLLSHQIKLQDENLECYGDIWMDTEARAAKMGDDVDDVWRRSKEGKSEGDKCALDAQRKRLERPANKLATGKSHKRLAVFTAIGRNPKHKAVIQKSVDKKKPSKVKVGGADDMVPDVATIGSGW
ncbi:hypothetical protein B0H10DRAFT_2206767 [Mycena sp. CBHHK59/15]|nr:hypothetical protein B0H10DRAFT_2206767 [Mycena sp. CBHHK59/15]